MPTESTDTPTLVHLLEQARGNDPACLNRLFAECRNFLEVLARAQIGAGLRAKADASDLVQQTMLEAYRDFHRFRGQTEAEWLAWLRRILAHNVANFIRQYRGTSRRQVSREVHLATGDSSDAAVTLPPADSAETPSRLLLRKERELQVADALAQLPPDYQEVIVLRNLQRLPFDEVAARLGRSRPAAQMLWMRAIQKLQVALAALNADGAG